MKKAKSRKQKNKDAVALGKRSWNKRKNKEETPGNLSRAGALGAQKTNQIKAAKRLALTNRKTSTQI